MRRPGHTKCRKWRKLPMPRSKERNGTEAPRPSWLAFELVRREHHSRLYRSNPLLSHSAKASTAHRAYSIAQMYCVVKGEQKNILWAKPRRKIEKSAPASYQQITRKLSHDPPTNHLLPIYLSPACHHHPTRPASIIHPPGIKSMGNVWEHKKNGPKI